MEGLTEGTLPNCGVPYTRKTKEQCVSLVQFDLRKGVKCLHLLCQNLIFT